jgi:Tol biopolymer transport system component
VIFPFRLPSNPEVKFMRRIPGCLLLIALAAAAQTPQQLFEQGLVKERSEGKLQEAIQLYQRAAAAAGKNRALAAKALVEAGQCYQKLGNTESRKLFERVVNEYGDQKEAVALARVGLGGGAGKEMSFRPVWTDPKVDFDGTVSPDGRYVSYEDWDTGNLMLHDLATGEERQVTHEGTSSHSEYANTSAISRDGKQVAYGWFRSGKPDRYELRIASLGRAGAPPFRRLFESEEVSWIQPHDWSPDGKWIGVLMTRKGGSYQLGMVSVADGTLRVLKSFPRLETLKLQFSPDGRFIAYDLLSATGKGHRHVFLIPVEGGAETPVLADPNLNVVMGWSPDGKHLLFASDRSGALALWSLTMSDGKPQGPPQLLKAGLGNPWSLGVTRSGALYVGVMQQGPYNAEVASVDLASGSLLAPPSMPLKSKGGSNSNPDWSRDGRLSILSSRDPVEASQNRVITILKPETGSILELKPAMAWINNPRWSPDGRSLAVFGVDLENRQGIFRVDAQSGEVAPLVLGARAALVVTPSWSPDGKKIYYVRAPGWSGAGPVSGLVRDLAAGEEKEIARWEGSPSPLFPSPDDRLIARSNWEANFSNVVVFPSEGGSPRELLRVNRSRALSVLAWTPDGKELVVWERLGEKADWSPGDPAQLWLVNVADGQRRKLDLGGARVPPGTRISFHPDGRQIAYMTAEMSKTEIWVLENFLPAAK